jgi:molecular chaperone GrpE
MVEKKNKKESEIRKTTEESSSHKKSHSKKADKASTSEKIEELEKKLETAQEEAKETYDRLLRVSAEFENYKKRNEREMDDFRKFANESILKEILVLVDNLERAVNSSENQSDTDSCVVEGVNLTINEIVKVFEKFSVKQIESLEKPFDPNFHQAVTQEETDEYPENIVLKEFQKGYMIHDRLLRPAMVVVSKSRKIHNDPAGEEEKSDGEI